MLRKIATVAVTIVALSFGGQLSNTTGVIMTDWNGKTYNLDALLSSGKHVIIHQMYSG